jgi:MFS family permease
MQEARRLRPRNASALIGLLTAGYGLGQILGPALVAWVLPRTASVAQGFEWSLQAAAAGLVLGLVIYAGLARCTRDDATH